MSSYATARRRGARRLGASPVVVVLAVRVLVVAMGAPSSMVPAGIRREPGGSFRRAARTTRTAGGRRLPYRGRPRGRGDRRRRTADGDAQRERRVAGRPAGRQR